MLNWLGALEFCGLRVEVVLGIKFGVQGSFAQSTLRNPLSVGPQMIACCLGSTGKRVEDPCEL